MNIQIKEIIATYEKENCYNKFSGKYSFTLQVLLDLYVENIRYVLVYRENMMNDDFFLYDFASKIERDENSFTRINNPKENKVCRYVLSSLKESRKNMIEKYKNNSRIEFEINL